MLALFTAKERERTTTQAVSELTKVAGVDRVFPFGSIARGTPDRHSDVDIAVVVAAPRRRWVAIHLVTDC